MPAARLPGEERAVRLEDVQALALQNHPAGAEAEALRRIGRAGISAARAWEDPLFDVSFGRGEPALGGPSASESGFEITQELPSPLAYKHRIQSAEYVSAEHDSKGRARRLELLYEVEILFLDHAAAVEASTLLTQNAEGGERFLSLTARRVELGEARETERIRAEIELLRIRRALAAAAREVETSRHNLRRLVGPGLPDALRVEPVWPNAASVESFAQLQSRMETRNPELLAARARASGSEEAALAAAWSAWPNLAANYYDIHEIDKDSRGGRLGIRVPLWNAGRPEAARRRAESSLARAEQRRLEIDLGNALERAYGDLRVAAEQGDAFATRLLPAAREGLRLVELGYAEGETSFLDLLDAQRTYRETAAELVDIRREAARALAAIHRLTGGSDAKN
jgi:cobalt-zinc-cadmium efflux system outer membrane protein